MRIRAANLMKQNKIQEFKDFYESKFKPVNKNILYMIESTPKEFVPTKMKTKF